MSADATSMSLLQRLRLGPDDEAWERFHALYTPLLRSWLVRRGVQQQDADDLLQDVMVIALRELPQFVHNGRTGALRCWLRNTMSNRLKGLLRKQNRQRPVSDRDGYDNLADQLADPNSETSRDWDEEYQRVVCERLLKMVEGEFQPQTMTAFRAVALEGNKPSIVAAQLSMTANAVRIAQSRVLKRLREIGQGILD